MLKGHVFKKQLFESHIFAYFIDTFADKKCGIGEGFGKEMNINYTQNTITIEDGVALIKGRFIEEDSSTTLDVTGENSYCRLVIEIDLDKENTEEELKQASYKIIKSKSSYPELIQQDITKTNSGIYQFGMLEFEFIGGKITRPKYIMDYINFESIYRRIETEYSQVLSDVESQSSVMLKNDFICFEASYDNSIIRYPSGYRKTDIAILGIKAYNLSTYKYEVDPEGVSVALQENNMIVLGTEEGYVYEIIAMNMKNIPRQELEM